MAKFPLDLQSAKITVGHRPFSEQFELMGNQIRLW